MTNLFKNFFIIFSLILGCFIIFSLILGCFIFWIFIKYIRMLLINNNIIYKLLILGLFILMLLICYFCYINSLIDSTGYVNEILDYNDLSSCKDYYSDNNIKEKQINYLFNSFFDLFKDKINYFPSYFIKDNFVIYYNSIHSENTANIDITNEVKYLLKLTENILDHQRSTINNINTILRQ